MTLVGGPLTRIDAVNMIPFHSIRENLKYGHSPISWDMLYNIVMFVPFGIIYCYYQKTFCIYKAIGLSVLTTFSIEMAQFIFKTGVVDIDDLIVNTIGSLVGIFFYITLQKILQRAQMLDVHEVIDTVATILPPLFITFVVEMFFGDGSPKLLFIHNIVLISYGIFDYTFLINDFSWKSKLFYSNDELYKYERCTLLIVDFKYERPVLYRSTSQLIEAGLLPKSFSLPLEALSFDTFTNDILTSYAQRFDLNNLKL